MNGTEAESIAYPALLVAFYVVMGAVLVGGVIVALVRQYLRHRPIYRPLPQATRIRWQSDAETPIGNALLAEFLGGPR